ncbi:MAG TPA: iron-containing alcohol dehydrogenase PsrA [Usitatibacter sp.]|nr:iron-containing alcohol dehydrogenase PsrA [Usitatibacter sp.]
MWAYRNPVTVRFGWDALSQLPAVLGARDAVLVTFPEARAMGLVERIRALVGTRLREVIEDVEPNPETSWFAQRYDTFWKRNAGVTLIAVGGGSAIDTAKLLQVATPRADYGSLFEALANGRQPVVARAMPLIAIPTTAGTGSEVTPWATLWDRTSAAPKKYSLHVEETWPEAALVDPALTLSAPTAVARNSALDALSHSLESIWNLNSNPVSDALAVEAARGVIATLPALLENPRDPEPRMAMSRASLMAGLAFSNTRTALAHSISYEMTLRHGLPHGLACSFTLPLVWRLAAGVNRERDQVLGRVFGASQAEPWRALADFLHGVGVKTSFSDYGVGREEAHGMIKHALDGARGRNFVNAAPQLDESIA